MAPLRCDKAANGEYRARWCAVRSWVFGQRIRDLVHHGDADQPATQAAGDHDGATTGGPSSPSSSSAGSSSTGSSSGSSLPDGDADGS